LHYNTIPGIPHRLAGYFALVTQTATSPQRKPLLDEASFQQLLSAAYVLQEHNDRLRAKGFQADFAENLAAIVETQKLIQTLQLDLAAASELVAERVQKVTNASGTAIGILDKGELFYRAATGTAAIDAGTRVAPDAALSGDCLSKGSALNYPDVTSNLHVRADFFRNRDVKAFIAVPVYHTGQVAGVLELRFARANSFREADVRTAELMAGLLSEAMVTAARMKWKEALASERQSMLEALERIKPQIERLGSESMSLEDVGGPNSLASPAERSVVKHEPPARVADTCAACGTDFFDESESFCGTCGAARPVAPPPLDLPRVDVPKADPPWLIPYGRENPTNGNSATERQTDSVLARETAVPSSLPTTTAPGLWPTPSDAATQDTVAPKAEPVSKAGLESGTVSAGATNLPSDPFQLPAEDAGADGLRIIPADPLHSDLVPANPFAPAAKIQPYPWGSAKKAQQWLETVKAHQGPRAEWLAQQWQRRRANFYVVMAAVILLMVISGWGFRPAGTTAAGNASPTPNSQQQVPPPPQLTLFEKLMVNLGLAEPPPAPVDMGNPNAQVWVDVHTALYYCSGSDLYGKTADGKFTTQRDAQQDQFEPSNRKACP
jgi:putative methionine-R-sulfoxide reductase with GAF domain